MKHLRNSPNLLGFHCTPRQLGNILRDLWEAQWICKNFANSLENFWIAGFFCDAVQLLSILMSIGIWTSLEPLQLNLFITFWTFYETLHAKFLGGTMYSSEIRCMSMDSRSLAIINDNHSNVLPYRRFMCKHPWYNFRAHVRAPASLKEVLAPHRKIFRKVLRLSICRSESSGIGLMLPCLPRLVFHSSFIFHGRLRLMTSSKNFVFGKNSCSSERQWRYKAQKNGNRHPIAWVFRERISIFDEKKKNKLNSVEKCRKGCQRLVENKDEKNCWHRSPFHNR